MQLQTDVAQQILDLESQRSRVAVKTSCAHSQGTRTSETFAVEYQQIEMALDLASIIFSSL